MINIITRNISIFRIVEIIQLGITDSFYLHLLMNLLQKKYLKMN